jgi:hypothetical protein
MKNIIGANETNPKVNVTPLTSLVVELVESGESIEDAKSLISTSLGIDLKALNSDPIETLKSGTPKEKIKAASMMKSILTIQKFAEIVSSVSNDVNQSHKDVFRIIAEKLKSNTGGEATVKFDDVLDASNTDALIDSIALESGSTLEKDKFNAIKELTKNSVSILNDINITELAEAENIEAQLSSTASSIEVLIIPLKEKLVEIQQATTISEIEDKEDSAHDIVKAIATLGGIEGVSTTLDNKDDNHSLSDFTNSFLTDDKVKEEVDNYHTAINEGLDIDDIISEIKIKMKL